MLPENTEQHSLPTEALSHIQMKLEMLSWDDDNLCLLASPPRFTKPLHHKGIPVALPIASPSFMHTVPRRFCIPFTLATTLGLSALALDLPITVLEANEGLVPPAAAFFLLGKFGGILMTIMLLM